MRESLEETKNTVEMTERPIVYVESIKTALYAGSPIRPAIFLVNKRRTAAKDITIYFRFARPIHHTDYPQDYESPVNIPFLAANDAMMVEAAPADAVTFDDETLDAIMQKEKPLFIYGKGSYKDMRGKEYTIEKYAFTFHKDYGFLPDDSLVSLWKTNEVYREAQDRQKTS